MEQIITVFKTQVAKEKLIICSKKITPACYILDTPDKFYVQKRICKNCRKVYNQNRYIKYKCKKQNEEILNAKQT